MSPVELIKREQNIVELASELLGSLSELDEATIDSQFLFRFEPVWCGWVKQIRQMIWGLLEEDNDTAFSRINGEHVGLAIHLEKNKGVGVGLGPEGLFIENNGHGYRPFNKLLCEWVDKSLLKKLTAKARRAQRFRDSQRENFAFSAPLR